MKELQILLVEDNDGDILLTLEAFEECKIKNRVSVVKNGEEALDYVFQMGNYKTSAQPDLILMDINIPIMSGLDVLNVIKQDPKLKKIPVIMLTTSSSEKDVNKAFQNHANSYIIKPIEFDDFLKAVLKIEEFWFQLSSLPK